MLVINRTKNNVIMKFSSVIRFFLLFGLLISIVFICKAHQQEASVIVKAKNVIWTNPEGKQNIETYFPGEWVNVQNVEFKPNETVIRLLVRNQRPNISLNIPSSTVIKDKNKEYALRSVDGHEIGKQFNLRFTKIVSLYCILSL